MKKMWLIAVIVCAALMVSCGGEKKGGADDVSKDPIVAKAQEFYKRASAINEAQEKFEQISDRMRAYDENLSEEDRTKATLFMESLIRGTELPSDFAIDPKIKAKVTEAYEAYKDYMKSQNDTFALYKELSEYEKSLSDADRLKFEMVCNALVNDEDVSEAVKLAEAKSKSTIAPEVELESVETESEEAVNPVVAKATELTTSFIAAEKAGDQDMMDNITVQMQQYTKTLSEADFDLFFATSDKIMAAKEEVAAPAVEPELTVPALEVEEATPAVNPDVVAKATEFANKIVTAAKAEDDAALEKLAAQVEAYTKTLTEAELEVFDATGEKIVASAGL